MLMSYDGFNKGRLARLGTRARTPGGRSSTRHDVTNANNVTFTNAGTGLTPDIRVVKAAVFNTLTTAEANAKYRLNDVFTIKGGVALKSFDFQTKQVQRLYGNNGPTGVTATGTIPFNLAQSSPPTSPAFGPAERDDHGLWQAAGLPAGSVTSRVVPDVDAWASASSACCATGHCANKYGDFTLAINSALGQQPPGRGEGHRRLPADRLRHRDRTEWPPPARQCRRALRQDRPGRHWLHLADPRRSR
ncbi:hypothetical protein ACRAWD_03165 [Caulobacter segnis]